MVKKLTQNNLFFVVGITTILILTYSMIFIFRHIFIEDYDLIYPSKLYPWILVVPQIFMLVFSIIYLKNLRQLFLNVKLINYFFAFLFMFFNLSFYWIYAQIVSFLNFQILYLPNISKYILGDGNFIFLNIFAICVWVPAIEEIFFRGLILKRFNEFSGKIFAVIFSSFLFCIVHGGVGLLIPVFFSSILISILFLMSKSLLPCIMLHSIQNLFVCIVATFA